MTARAQTIFLVYAIVTLLVIRNCSALKQPRANTATLQQRSSNLLARADIGNKESDRQVVSLFHGFSNLDSSTTVLPSCLTLRGGGVVGIAATLIRTLFRNPLLMFLMIGSTLVIIYEQQVPYVKQIQSFVQACMVAYFFYLLIEWQSMQNEAANES